MARLFFSLLCGTGVLGVLVATVPATAQPRGAAQAPTQLPPRTAPSQQLPSVNQLRERFTKSCMAKASNPQQSGYCNCAFNALLRRYSPQQYVVMDSMIIRGGQPVSQFARVAWEPEFGACRASFMTQQSR